MTVDNFRLQVLANHCTAAAGGRHDRDMPWPLLAYACAGERLGRIKKAVEQIDPANTVRGEKAADRNL